MLATKLINIRPILTQFSPLLFVKQLHIQTASTPNEDALKFLPDQQVLGPGARTVEFLNLMQTDTSPLANKLFKLEGIQGVLLGPDFITIEKEPEEEWPQMKPKIIGLLTEHLTSGEPIVDEVEQADFASYEDEDEVVSMIKELIDTRIRPAIQEDGGDLDYMGFTNDGIVQLKLRGSCRSCSSSSVTLKNGIESMLMHYIEEVKGVEQVLDEQEQSGIQEFEKFESKLQEQMKRKGDKN